MKNLTFNTYLNAILLNNEPALNLILSQLCRQINYKKNDIIYPKGKIPENLSYLETGNAIALSQSKPNRQVLRFWEAKQLICPCGFFNNTPSAQSIVALDDCLISVLNYRQLLGFLHDFPEGYKILNAIIQSEINHVMFNIKSLDTNRSCQNHEALLDALAISFDE